MTTAPTAITLLYGWLDVEAGRQNHETTGRLNEALDVLQACALDGEPVLYAHLTDLSCCSQLHCNEHAYARYDHLEIILSGDVRDKLMMRVFRLPLLNGQASVSIIGGLAGTARPPDHMLAGEPFGSTVFDGQLRLFE